MNFTKLHNSTPELESEFKVSSLSFMEEHRSVLPFQRTNDYRKLLRIAALVLKFLRKRVYDRVPPHRQVRLGQVIPLLAVSSDAEVVGEDIRAAELLLLREHQRESTVQLRLRPVNNKFTYHDDTGLIRVATRMRNAELIRTVDEPVLLAPNHLLTTMIINRCHQTLFHAETEQLVSVLRRRYFIPRIRATARSVIRGCVPCRRQQARPYKYPNPPDFPIERVTRSRHFQRIALDYFGPS
ncbi:hypothetical protein OSTOST_00513 [Ostertagia ostertagi]